MDDQQPYRKASAGTSAMLPLAVHDDDLRCVGNELIQQSLSRALGIPPAEPLQIRAHRACLEPDLSATRR